MQEHSVPIPHYYRALDTPIPHFAGDPKQLDLFICRITQLQKFYNWSDFVASTYAIKQLDYPASIQEIYTKLRIVPHSPQELFDALRQMFANDPAAKLSPSISAKSPISQVEKQSSKNSDISISNLNSSSKAINPENSISHNLSESSISSKSISSLNKSSQKQHSFISINLIGPFQNQFHILSIFNKSSHHLQLIPIQSTSCSNIIRKISKYISLYGSLSCIHTDINQLINSRKFHQFTASLNIQVVQSYSYHPHLFIIAHHIQYFIYHSIIALTNDGNEWFKAVNILMMLFNSNSNAVSPTYGRNHRQHNNTNFNFMQCLLQLKELHSKISNNLKLSAMLFTPNVSSHSFLHDNSQFNSLNSNKLKFHSHISLQYKSPRKIIPVNRCTSFNNQNISNNSQNCINLPSSSTPNISPSSPIPTNPSSTHLDHNVTKSTNISLNSMSTPCKQEVPVPITPNVSVIMENVKVNPNISNNTSLDINIKSSCSTSLKEDSGIILDEPSIHPSPISNSRSKHKKKKKKAKKRRKY